MPPDTFAAMASAIVSGEEFAPDVMHRIVGRSGRTMHDLRNTVCVFRNIRWAMQARNLDQLRAFLSRARVEIARDIIAWRDQLGTMPEGRERVELLAIIELHERELTAVDIALA